MFCENKEHEQLKLFSFYKSLKPEVKKLIASSWAPSFFKKIFMNIDESKFKDMYSDKSSRPNKPVNTLVGLEIIKQLFNYTDNELILAFHTDFCVMHALGLESPGEMSLSPRTLYYFRENLVKYDTEHGTSLLKEVLKDISLDLIGEFDLDLSLQRMDSSMIEANIKRLTRLNLFVKVVHNFLKTLQKDDLADLPQDLQSLLKRKNLDISYKLKDEQAKEKLSQLAEYVSLLFDKFKDDHRYKEGEELKNLKRLLEEHLNITAGPSPEIELKELEDIPSGSLQNPSDPDATYRKKQGKHKGYVGNFAETCSKENSFQVITEVEVMPNNTPDTELLYSSLDDEHSLVSQATDVQTDGGYGGEGPEEKCSQHGIHLHVTGMTGPKEVKRNQNLADVVIANGVFKECPAGNKPYKQWYKEEKQYYGGRFKTEVCEGCPQLSKCFVMKRKNFFGYGFKKREHEVKKKRRELKDPEYRIFLNGRAGVESLVYMIFFKSGKRTRLRGLSRVRNSIICRAIGINLLRLLNHTRNDNRTRRIKALSLPFLTIFAYIRQLWLNIFKFPSINFRFGNISRKSPLMAFK